MDLREWLFRNEMTQTVFARELYVNPTYLGRVVRGKQNPGSKLAKKIVEATNGEVTFEDLFFKEEMPKQKRINRKTQNEI